MPAKKSPTTFPTGPLGSRKAPVEPCRGPLCGVGNRAVLAQAGGGITLPAQPGAARMLKATIITHPISRLSENLLKVTTGIVSSRLNAIHKFKVTVAKKQYTKAQAKALLDRDLVVYLFKGDISAAVSTAQRHLPTATRDVLLQEANAMLQTEGGVNLSIGNRSVSFVNIKNYETTLSLPGGEKDEKKIGLRLGWVIAHEFGHALSAVHADGGIMKPVLTTDLDIPVPIFTKASRAKMLARLKVICRCPSCK